MAVITARSATIFFGTRESAARAPFGLEVEPDSIQVVLLDGKLHEGMLDVFRRAQHLARLEERSRRVTEFEVFAGKIGKAVAESLRIDHRLLMERW